jgi:hypothetical protein
MADLATYQNQANSIYDPQQQNEAAQLAADKTAQINTLEGNKGTITQDYNVALQNLAQSTQDNTGKINQLYTSRLAGNMSGLQGNDMGQMFARAHQDQTNIETTRANKLNDLAIQEGNVNNKFTVDSNALGGKYSALKNQYAYAGYANALKQEQQQAYQNAQLQMAQQRINASYANANTTRANTAYNQQLAAEAGYKVKQGSQGQYMYTDRNGTPISMAEYISGAGGGSGQVLDLLKNGTGYDKNVYNKVKNLSGDQLQSALASYKVYGF